MKKIKYIILVILGLLLVGCSNAEEKLNDKAILEIDRGNFIKASYLLNDTIKINPNYLEGMVNYRNIYPRALDQANENIKEYQKVSDYKLEAYAYEDLLRLKSNFYYADDIVHKKLGMSLELPTIEELYQLKLVMGEVYYKAGNELENRALNRLEKREKYYLYERGAELSPKYKDMIDRRKDAYKIALVKAMIEMSQDFSTSYREKLAFQIKGNIANGKKRNIVQIRPLNRSEFNYNWDNTQVSENMNTGIKISLDYKTVTPKSTRRSIIPITWYEQIIVQTKDGPKVNSLGRTYFRHDYYKSESVEIKLTYIMRDLSSGEIIGSRSFIGVGEDHYRWSTFSGNIPMGLSRSGYERNLKSREELINIAFADAISKLVKDITNKI